ncbi:MAG: right-handed parallel beta-helix repeat-containing protein [Phycisphaerales bacterium]|nr:right-handed parallel beta-helix repeat-containing protein [Phycisphaerales bacterium]
MMCSLSVRVVTSLFAASLVLFHAAPASGQGAPGLTLLSTPQGPITADLKWPASDAALQRSRFDLQSRARLAIPAVPTDLAAVDSGAESVTVSWGTPENFVTGYEIERLPPFASPVLVPVAAGTYSDPCGPGVFKYRARAVNLAGVGQFSAWTTTVVALQPPKAPSGMVATNAGDGSVQLGWTDNSSTEVRFEIQRSPGFPIGVSTPANVNGYSDLAGPGTFSYRVRAVNGAGRSDYTAWAEVNVTAPVPNAPTGLGVTDAGAARARLTWTDNSNNETGFQVQRNPAFPSGLVGVSANTTQYEDLCGPGSFSYRVRSINSAGGSSFTPWTNVNIAAPSLGVPTNVEASDAGNRRAMIAWTDTSTSETGFELQRSPAFSGPVLVGAGVTGYVDQCGVGTFNYRVRTLGPSGTASAYSSWASVNVANTIPAAPSGLTLQDMGDQVRVRAAWADNSDNETGFKIQREKQVSGNWINPTSLAAAANATSYLDNPGQGTYRYRVCASNSVGDSAFTAWLSVTVSTGWTVFTPSADTRIVYVSSSSGNDGNTGLSEASPKRTFSAAYGLLRHGYPDWMLLKRGDQWTTPFPSWQKSGRSTTEMMVVGSYGSSTVRPEIRTGSETAVYISGGSGSPPTINHLAFVGLHLSGVGRATSDSSFGIHIYKPGSDLLLEDCYFESYSANLNLQGDGSPFDNIRIRRCISVDAYSSPAHSQGIYADLLTNLLIEECVFDHNGWKEGTAEPTMFNHNIYIQSNCGPAIVRNNIIARAASHGAQVRGGGQVTNNLFVQNSLAGFVDKTPSTMSYNVVTNGKNIDPGNPRACGFEILANTPAGSVIESNLFTHPDIITPNAYAIYVGARGMVVKNNVVYDWASPTDGAVQFAAGGAFNLYQGTQFTGNKIVLPTVPSAVVDFDAAPWIGGIVQVSGNKYWSSNIASRWFVIGGTNLNLASWASLTGDGSTSFPASNFPAPTRDVAAYNASLGGPATIEDFLARARQQSKLNWNPEYTAAAVNTWMRAGFEIAEP